MAAAAGICVPFGLAAGFDAVSDDDEAFLSAFDASPCGVLLLDVDVSKAESLLYKDEDDDDADNATGGG